MKRKLPEKFFEQNQRANTRKWKFFNLSQALWGAGNREFRRYLCVLLSKDGGEILYFDDQRKICSLCPKN